MRPLLILSLIGLCLTACYTEAPQALPDSAQLGLAPLGRPDRERGAALFKENCAACHGERGRGDGWRVPELEGPRPRDFHDSQMMATMSPARAYLAITQGVPRTAMAAFDLLAPPDRWHLAFYVLALGHSEEGAVKGAESLANMPLAKPSPRSLSELTNKAIIDELKGRKLDEVSARHVLSYLRREAPYRAGQSPLADFRHSIASAIDAYRTGDHGHAKTLLDTALLDELKSDLKILRLRESGLALATELELRALHNLLRNGAPLREIEDRAQTLAASIDLAEPVLAREMSAGVGAAQSASIALSYAIDGALALFLLLVIGTRRGADRRERVSVGLGLISGLIIAVASWLLWSSLETPVSGSLRTTLSLAVSGTIALAGIPLLVGLVRHFRWPPQTRIHSAPSWLLFLFGLSTAIVVRDALEIVPAMTTIARATPAALLGFVGAGIAIICVVSVLVAMERRLGLSARTALLAMSTTTVATIAAGTAAKSAQELGLLGATQAGYMQSPWLALWPTAQGILSQLIIATACLIVLTVVTLLKQNARP